MTKTEDKQNWQETIEYVVDEMKGEPVYVGRSVNYNVCCQGKSIEDLQKKMATMIGIWIDHANTAMEYPLNMKEISHEEWEEEYKEWMKTSKWMNIANALYDHIKGIPKGKWDMEYEDAIQQYEKLTTRVVVKDRLKEM